MKKTHGELFAGIGGFGIGFDNAGFETKWHVEIDEHCQSVLSRHWPDVQIESDVCAVGKHNLPYVDVVTFGSPCQDLSIAGKRKGFQDGTRSNLFFEAVRIIREIEPRYAIWENVPGALSSHGGRDFQSVLESLLDASVPMPKSGRWATAGMVRTGQKEIAWRVLDAQYFGVPQRRRRIFLVFCPGGDSASEVLFESEGMSGNAPPSREAGKEVAYTLGTNTGSSSNKGDGGINKTMVYDGLNQKLDDTGIHRSLRVGRDSSDFVATIGALQARDYKGVGNQYVNEGKPVFDAAQITSKQHGSLPSKISQPLNTLGQMSVFDRQRSDEYGEAATVSTVAARDYKSASDLVTTGMVAFMAGQGAKAGSIAASENTFPTLKGVGSGTNQVPTIAIIEQNNFVSTPDMISLRANPAQPLIAQPLRAGRQYSDMGDGQTNVFPVGAGVRRLTPTECERLQGFPDFHIDGQADTQRYKQLGNAVAVPVVEWIAKRIAAVEF